MNTIQYCMDNPVRKEMIEKPEDYPYWKLWGRKPEIFCMTVASL